MGTRAQFFIGNPTEPGAEFLGTTAWDGYPDGFASVLADAADEESFRSLIESRVATRKDYSDPKENDFPFPWKDNLFLTDCTYAFFDGKTQFTWFHKGWIPLSLFLNDEEVAEAYTEQEDFLPQNVSAPSNPSKPPGPDSIMIISYPK